MPFQPPTPQHSSLSRLVRRQPLSVFFGATFAASWALWTPLVVARDELPGALGLVLRILGTAVPSVLALLFLAATFGKTGVRTILGRLLMWRVGTRWYVAVLGLSALLAVAVGVSVLFGGNAPTAAPAVSVVLSMFLFSIFPGSAVGEELGWRGFALPHLQAWRSALGASLILGAIWGLWHLPLWFTGSEFQRPVLYPAFFISTVAVSVIYTWMYNGTKGSLLIVVLFHATSNLPLTLFLTPMGSAGTQIFLIYVALTVMTAVVVVSVSRPENLSRTYPKQIASPADDIPHLRPTAQL